VGDNKKAERKARRQARRSAAKQRIEIAVGEWKDDHAIDPEEVPALRKAATKVLGAAGVAAIDAFDGDVKPASWRGLYTASLNFVVALHSALED
jgi:hypothetical protein